MDPLHLIAPGATVLERRGNAVRLRQPDGTVVWGKSLASARAFGHVLRAHAEVAPRWRASGTPLPQLLAHHATTRTVLLSELRGRPGSFAQAPEVFERAGRALRALHALPHDDADMPLDEALVQRAAAAQRSPYAPPAAVEVSRRIEQHRPALARHRVWCHRDYQPQNWLVCDDQLGVLDFEHTQPDHPLVDWVRLEARGWSSDQRSAFVEGYGSPEPVALQCLLGLYGIATVVWARQHHDDRLLAIGQGALDRAGL